MAVVSANEIDLQRTGAVDAEFQNTYSRTWRVLTDDRRDDALAVRGGFMALTGLRVGAPYRAGIGAASIDPFALVQSITATCVDEDGQGWHVTVPYGPSIPREESPLDQPPEFSYGFSQFERICDFDIYGKPLVNSAGDPFDPPVTVDDSRPLISIVRNEAAFDDTLADRYKDAINIDAFLRRDPLTVKCSQINARRAYHTKVGFYFIVTYEFHVNADTWVRRVLNQGYRSLTSGGARSTILVSGAPAQSPVPLAATGAVLAPTAPAIYLEFHVLKELPFSIFNLS